MSGKKTVAAALTEKMIQDNEAAGESVEFVVFAAAEAVANESIELSTFQAQGIIGKEAETSKQSWVRIFNLLFDLLVYRPDVLKDLATIGQNFTNSVKCEKVTGDRAFWSITFSSLRGEGGNSKICAVSLYSHNIMAEKFDMVTLAYTALARAFMTGDHDSFGKMVGMMMEAKEQCAH